MKKIIIGVMGQGEKASELEIKDAFELGKLIAEEGWILLSGGRDVGVMDAVNKGAKSKDGLTVGILPDREKIGMSSAVDIPIITDMGSARNNINVLSSNVVIACGVCSAGTLSEIALALKNKKRVVIITKDSLAQKFLGRIVEENIYFVSSPQEAVLKIKNLLK